MGNLLWKVHQGKRYGDVLLLSSPRPAIFFFCTLEINVGIPIDKIVMFLFHFFGRLSPLAIPPRLDFPRFDFLHLVIVQTPSTTIINQEGEKSSEKQRKRGACCRSSSTVRFDRGCGDRM